MQYLIAGNPAYGLSAAIADRISTDQWHSRSFNNTDLTSVASQKKFANDSLLSDVTVVVSCLWGYEQVINTPVDNLVNNL